MVNFEYLDNGVKLYKIPLETKTVGIAVVFNVGSIYENPEYRGISHFLEHMMFKSNYKYTYEQIDLGLELNGGIANAFTGEFLTAYLVEFLPDNYERILDILFSMINNFKYKEDEFEKEKKVVISEIERVVSDPEEKLYRDIPLSVYGKSDYGEPIGGYRETLENIDLQTLEEYKYKMYTKENMFIILEGNYNERIIDFIRKTFGKFENSGKNNKIPSKDRGKNIEEYMDTNNQIYYSLSVNLSIDKLKDITALSEILSGGISSKTFQIFRNKYGIGYHIELKPSYYYPDEFIFSLTIPGFEKDKLDYLDKAIDDLFNEKIDTNYVEGRIKRIKLKFEKMNLDIFRRLFSESYIIYYYDQTYEEFYNDIMKKMRDLEILENLKYIENGYEIFFYPEN